MVASLVPKEGGRSFQIDKPIVLIGRHQECDVSLQSSPKVSRRHCCIVQCGDRYIVRDLGSMNGVRVNGQRIIEAELHPGDIVSFADLLFQFHRPDKDQRGDLRAGQGNPSQAGKNEIEPADLSGAVPVLVDLPDSLKACGPPGAGAEPTRRAVEDDVRLAEDSHPERDVLNV